MASPIRRRDNSVNNRRAALRFGGLSRQTDSVTYAVISMETQRSHRLSTVPPRLSWRTLPVRFVALIPDPTLRRPPSTPSGSSRFPRTAGEFTAALPLKLREREERKKTTTKKTPPSPRNQCGSPTCIHNGPFNQFLSKIQLNCHGGAERNAACAVGMVTVKLRRIDG